MWQYHPKPHTFVPRVIRFKHHCYFGGGVSPRLRFADFELLLCLSDFICVSIYPIVLSSNIDGNTSENNLCLVVNTVFSICEWLKCIAALPSESKSFCLHFAPLAVIHYRLLSPSVTKDTRGIRGCASCVSACHRWFTLNQGENRGLLTRSSKAADVSD